MEKLLLVILTAAMPISELRGAIPLAIYQGFSPIQAYFLSVFGNILPIPILLVFLDRVLNFFKKWKATSSLVKFFEARALKNKKLVEKYGYAGLAIFVAIPLPITGAWTGSLLSVLLELRILKSFIFITLGVLIAGLIVLLSVEGVFTLNSFL